MANQVTLHDGSKVLQALMATVFMSLQNLQKENPIALWDLAMKCQRASHVIVPLPGMDQVSLLQEYKLLDNEKKVPLEIQAIVLNSIEDVDGIDDNRRITNLVLRNPLADPQPNNFLPEASGWSWCTLL